MSVPMWLFVAWVVFTLVLAWRVGVLSDRIDLARGSTDSILRLFRHIKFPTGSDYTECLGIAVPHEIATKKDIRRLATALGYEWKRTEAKEGWEKKKPFYGSPFFKCDPFADIDLSGHYVAPKPPTKRPTKRPTKKRRATH